MAREAVYIAGGYVHTIGAAASGPVALDAATLAALETIGLDAATLAALETINVGNFPAVQSVSGPLTDAQLRASAVPVSGFPGTQPVSGPLTDAQLRASAVPVSGPTLTKATQGATGFATQDLKDSGRVAVTISGYQVAGIITTEALLSANLVRAADGVTAAAAQQFTVTAGKRLRIEAVSITVKNNAAAAGTSKLALRYRPAGGTVAITDSIVAILDIGSNNATIANYIGPYLLPVPDGFEMIGGATFGFTNLSSAATMLHTITLIGFEY